MNRRNVSSLKSGDQIHVQAHLFLEVIETLSLDDGRVQLTVRPVACGPVCGSGCECHTQMLSENSEYQLSLKAGLRLPFLGNLAQLLADSERLRNQIARLKGVAAEDGEAIDLDVISVSESNTGENHASGKFDA
jgi:hypothetical protein